MKYTITPDLIRSRTKRRPGTPLLRNVRFLVAHDTGNPGSTAKANVSYYKRTADERSASAHLFVDDRDIIECIPALTATPEKAWHVRYDVGADNSFYGVDANDAAIAVEYCYGGRINDDQAYDRYVWVLAHLCQQFRLDPTRDLVGHFMLDPSRRTDPVTGLAASRRTYEQLLRDVPAEYARLPNVVASDASPLAPKNPISRVRVNVRADMPSRRAPVLRVLAAGSHISVIKVVPAGEPVNGNPVWYEIGPREFVWSGAFE